MNRNGKMHGNLCEPAASVIAKFGGVRPLARELGLDPSTISKWQTRSRKHGTEGLIPARYHWTLLALARSRSIELEAEELIHHE